MQRRPASVVTRQHRQHFCVAERIPAAPNDGQEFRSGAKLRASCATAAELQLAGRLVVALAMMLPADGAIALTAAQVGADGLMPVDLPAQKGNGNLFLRATSMNVLARASRGIGGTDKASEPRWLRSTLRH